LDIHFNVTKGKAYILTKLKSFHYSYMKFIKVRDTNRETDN